MLILVSIAMNEKCLKECEQQLKGEMVMEFRNREELNDFLSTLKYIGEGIQGQSLLDKKANQVYKIFSEEELEGADYGYTYNDIMGLSHIKNDTFIWPNDVIMIEDLVAGYTHSYFEGKNFCDFNDPFGVNLDNLSNAKNIIFLLFYAMRFSDFIIIGEMNFSSICLISEKKLKERRINHGNQN